MRGLLQKFPQKFGSYVLLSPLGAGGMGAVYLAMSGHREMETLCVVKRMLPALLSQPDHVRRFRHEADLARQLVHSNLANTHSIGVVSGEVFLVQEFVEGQDVSALLDRMAAQGRALPVPVATYIVGEIARGLSHAHDFENLNLVHRDINPPNVRLTYAGEVKLLDFGIASSDLHGEPSDEHRAAGKLWHLAPEQLRPGAKLDRRTDIYALGILLWELLTQKPLGTSVGKDGTPVAAPETEGEVLVWISRGEHALPSTFNADVPPELDAVVRKATSLDPADRFASADDFRRALATFVATEVHPELWLSMALKEMFSPENERAERRRLIESGRHLLDIGPDRRVARGEGLARTTPASTTLSRWQRPRWLMPIAVGALVGMATLFWLRLAADRADDGAQRTQAAAATSPVAPTAPLAPEMKAAASAQRTMLGPPAAAQQPVVDAKAAPPKPGAARSTSASGAKVQAIEPKGRAVGKTGSGDGSATAKVDHLALARQAFNLRDWNRALDEGRRAIAAGGGAEAFAVVGNTYFKMGKFADAEEQYRRALALEPDNALLRERASIARARLQGGSVAKE